MGRGGGRSATSLAPGFRFHPTDEELVRYYLKRKVTNKPFRFDPINVIDIYKSEPWDLPGLSKLKTRDLEWYFFSALDRKYSNGSKTNRATEKGYWKTTGKDRPIRWNSRTVGMKKTLVYHRGRAPHGERTNWVMHEYRLADEELEKAGVVQDALVLCRIFQKSGTGPKNGERYGAPLIEEEWYDDEQVAVLPGEEVTVAIASDQLSISYDVGDIDLFENDVETATQNIAQPLNFYQVDTIKHASIAKSEDDRKPIIGVLEPSADQSLNYSQVESSNHEQQPIYSSEDDQKPFIGVVECETAHQLKFNHVETSNHMEQLINMSEDEQKHFIGGVEPQHRVNVPNEQNWFRLPGQYDVETEALKDENVTESSNDGNAVGGSYFFNGPYLDAIDSSALTEGLYLESDDLSYSIGPDPTRDSTAFDMVDEYLNFFDVDDENLTFDAAELLGSENAVLNQASPSEADMHEGKSEATLTSLTHGNADTSSSNQNAEPAKFESDIKYPFVKQASQILGTYSAPPVLASEFPAKDSAFRLYPGQSSSTIHVTAGMIRIESLTLDASGLDWSSGKGLNINIVLSFPSSLVPDASTFSGKTGSMATPPCFFLMMCLWVLILSVSYKMGTYIYTNKSR